MSLSQELCLLQWWSLHVRPAGLLFLHRPIDLSNLPAPAAQVRMLLGQIKGMMNAWAGLGLSDCQGGAFAAVPHLWIFLASTLDLDIEIFSFKLRSASLPMADVEPAELMEDCQSIRQRARETGQLTAWPCPNTVGKPSVQAMKLNVQILCLLAMYWCKLKDSPEMLPIDWLRKQACGSKHFPPF